MSVNSSWAKENWDQVQPKQTHFSPHYVDCFELNWIEPHTSYWGTYGVSTKMTRSVCENFHQVRSTGLSLLRLWNILQLPLFKGSWNNCSGPRSRTLLILHVSTVTSAVDRWYLYLLCLVQLFSTVSAVFSTVGWTFENVRNKFTFTSFNIMFRRGSCSFLHPWKQHYNFYHLYKRRGLS